jgi:hypothetical protein
VTDAYVPPGGPQFDKQKTPAESGPGEDDDRLLEMFDRWDADLQGHWSQWVEDAKGWYDFVAGKQWTVDEVAQMEENRKIPVTFNLIAPVVDAVNGAEIQDRQQVQYYPRTPDVQDTGIADVLTQGAEYVVDQCNGDQEDTESFWDCLVCGIGWTETRVEVEGEHASIIKERVDPLQMKADACSRKRCFEDGRYVKREIPMSEDEFEDFKAEIGRADLEGVDGGIGNGKRLTVVNPRQRYTHGMLGEGGDQDPDVVVCEWQWWEREAVHVAPMPHPTQPGVTKLTPMSPAEFGAARQTQPGLRSVQSTRKVYYRAFVGDGAVLFKETLKENSFRYKAITGKRDRNAGTYYGLVKPMVEPGKFVNKLYSEVLHIVRTNANGGMLLEEDAVVDVKQFERTWSATDKITWVKAGALSGAHGAKMMPKAPPPVQPALFQLMEFARDMVKACTGVNEEILGLVGREQAGVLEQQRKQAAYGILSSFFDAKRRYQREQGRLLLVMMRLYLPEDFLVRILADGEKKYVPLAMALQSEEFDVIVDEAPASPNVKAKVAAILMPLLPQLLEGGMIGPEVVADMFQFLDLPAVVAEKLGAAVRQQNAKDAAPDPKQEQAEADQQANLQADTAEKGAAALSKRAKAFKDVTDAQTAQIGLGVEFLQQQSPAPAPTAPTNGAGPPGGGLGMPPGGGPPAPASLSGGPPEGPPPGAAPPEEGEAPPPGGPPPMMGGPNG